MKTPTINVSAVCLLVSLGKYLFHPSHHTTSLPYDMHFLTIINCNFSAFIIPFWPLYNLYRFTCPLQTIHGAVCHLQIHETLTSLKLVHANAFNNSRESIRARTIPGCIHLQQLSAQRSHFRCFARHRLEIRSQ